MVNTLRIVLKSTKTRRREIYIWPVDSFRNPRCNEMDRKYLQQKHFSDVMKALNDNLVSKEFAVKKSQLNKLNPILHDGILRVGGRLERSTMSFNAKHPMILPQHHHVTDLIIQHYHRQEGHTGPTQVLAAIRQMFWIIHGLLRFVVLSRIAWTVRSKTRNLGRKLWLLYQPHV